MIVPVFPCYIWISNISGLLNLDTINQTIDQHKNWQLIRTRNNRSPDQLTDQYGRLWDDIDINSASFASEFKVIRHELDNYTREIKASGQPYISSAWIHEYDTDKNIEWHNHRGAQSVGVLYLRNYEHGGEVDFLDPKEYCLQNEPQPSIRNQEIFTYKPIAGDLIIFPGYLKHKSNRGVGSLSRRVIGFHFTV